MYKKIFNIQNIFFLVTALMVIGCAKDNGAPRRATEDMDLGNKAMMQAYFATVNASRNAIYVDGALTSGAVIASGGIFPTASTAYAFALTSGLHTLQVRDTLRTATQVPLTFPIDVRPTKSYTIFLYDTISSPKQKMVENNVTAVNDGMARIRVANFIYSKVDLPGIDIYSAVQKTNIATNVKITDVTEFIPYTPNISDTFSVRFTGTTTDLVNYIPATLPALPTPVAIKAALNPRADRYYTLVFRGSYTTTTNSAAQTRVLSSFTNF